MRFKNKTDFENQRKEVLAKAADAVEHNKQEEATELMNQIEKMDNDWETDKVEIANAAALAGRLAGLQNVHIGEGEVMGINDALDNSTDDPSNDIGYRNSFMNYVIKGGAVPQLSNQNQNTTTGDVGAVIPQTIIQKIIEKVEYTGMIYAKVVKTAYKAGVSIPTSSIKPVATWVAEGATSDKQKKTLGSISFSHFKLRCAVSVSLETDVMALEVFERTLINNIAEAVIKAIEQSIISGTGSGMPTGILAETVETGQNIDIAKGKDLTLSTIEDAEAALPLEYEAGAVWIMTKKTYLKAKTVKDTTGQYIFREEKGVNGSIKRYLNEREVVLCNYLPNVTDTITKDEVVAILFRLEDYVFNTNYSMGIMEYYDHDTEDKIRKAVLLADGKVVDKRSLVTITKKFA